MPRTRAGKAAPAAPKEETPVTSTKIILDPQPAIPSQIVILPSRATAEARIATLPHPRHGRPSRYLVCPDTGIYEFTKITAPKTTPRSWLVEATSQSVENKSKENAEDLKTRTTSNANLYMATAIDPLFLLLPALTDSKGVKDDSEQRRMFLESDDYFDKLSEGASHLSEVLRCDKTRRLIETRMWAICDTVEAGDATMFRLSENKVVTVILDKARRMCEGCLPQSMEEKFVKKALEAPILVQKRDVSSIEGRAVPIGADSEVSTPLTDSNDTQSTTTASDAASSFVSQPSTAATSFTDEAGDADGIVSAMEASTDVVRLQRLRVAFNFICSSYIAPQFADRLQKLAMEEEISSVNFALLDDYLAKLAKLRSEAMASRSLGDYSGKHGRDEEEDEARMEKKRKLEEEKKRKASASRGVKDLKKVNTAGMKKMSDFFKKK